MKHWWVPGLQIGYEHTFIHQVADFLQGIGSRAEARAHIPGRSCDRLRDGRSAEISREWAMGRHRISELGGLFSPDLH